MAAKAIVILCAQALLIQSALTQCINRGPIPAAMGVRGWGYDSLPYDGIAWNRGLGCAGPLDFTPTSGGALPVSSISPIAPTGLSVVSDNVYEGALTVIGELPFIAAVTIEGTLPTAGAGVIDYGCGNGITAMASEGFGPAGPIYNGGVAPGRFYGYGCGDIFY